jgi:signal transduction histidine kinase
MRRQTPAEFAAIVAEPARLVCAPMAAGGRMIGVILADRLMSEPELQDADRRLLWTLGKAAALASVVRSVSTQFERASALEQRIDLAREIHDDVIQRLFGVSMALDGEGDLPAAARERCAAETQTALGDLRTALQRPLARAPRATGTTLLAELARLRHVHAGLELRLEAGGDVVVPSELEPLAQSVLIEAVRNAAKHANPTRVSVRIGRDDEAFWMEVVNDGVDGKTRGRARAGMGLRLAALEALGVGGVIEFGEREGGRDRLWQLRLVVPIPDAGEPDGD